MIVKYEGRSEAVEVSCDEPLYIVEVRKVLKDSIFKDGMELMLNAREDRSLLVLINPTLVEVRIPVQLVKVDKPELMDHLSHAGFHLCLVHVGIVLPRFFGGHLDACRFIPRVGTFKPRKIS